MPPRQGFTLIELLLVIVVIGVLAAIAVPKFTSTRERAYFKAMQADLRTLNMHQELHYAAPANNYTYGGSLSDFPEFRASDGVVITITEATTAGWSAQASHAALGATQQCAVYMGTVAAPPSFVSGAGAVACTGD